MKNHDHTKHYVSQINEVLDYIDRNLTRSFTLEELAAIAGFSKYHFHRIFTAFLGETLFRYIQRLRLEKAARLLLERKEESITQIAMDVGFSGSAPFSRAFKEVFCIRPSDWKKKHRNSCHNLSNPEQSFRKNGKDLPNNPLYHSVISSEIVRYAERETMNKGIVQPIGSVRVERIEQMTLAYIRYIGPYQGDELLFERLFNQLSHWANPKNMIRFPEAKCIIVYHDDPDITQPEKLRISVCISVPSDTKVQKAIGKMVIDSGKCAIGHFEVRGDEFGKAWNYMYGFWLPHSGYVPDDRHCFELYPKEKETHPEGKYTVDIHVPLKSAE